MSTLKVNAIQDTAGVERYMARAWVNFNGTGTVAIRASGNVSSVTDFGVGNYRLNFSSAMPDANYAAVATGGPGNWGALVHTANDTNSDKATTYCDFLVSANAAASRIDAEVCVAVFR